ncbi:MAG TPA: LytTR family DNA-binding domain-containing protein [Chitinophagaceae bacterium]
MDSLTNSITSNILIIENDGKAVGHLKKLLRETMPAAKVKGSCLSLKEAMKWQKTHELPDLIFSVIVLSDGMSFDILRKLKKSVPVIFMCNDEKYAIDAFRAKGLHYLLKPIKKEDLQEALNRFYETSQPKDRGKKTEEVKYHDRFIVSIGQQLKLIKSSEIAYFYTEHKLVYLVTFEGSKYTTNFTLELLESQLNPADFFRINRQYIINLSAIVKMIPASKSRLQVILKPESPHIPVTSTGRTDKFCKWMLGDL